MAAGRKCSTCGTVIYPHERCSCGTRYENAPLTPAPGTPEPSRESQINHPSSSEFSPTCQYCEQVVWERIVVPPSIHPDQQLFVCEEHAAFIESVGLTIEDLVNPDPFR